MQAQPYYFELEDQLKMFVSALDGCIAKRYDKFRVPKQSVAVRYVNAPKQRAFFDLVDKAQHITLPAVAVVIKGVALDKNRFANKLYGSDARVNGQLKHIEHPLPVNISIDVSIMTHFQSDLDQILSNMLAYFQPYIVISWDRMALPFNEIRNKISWNGNISIGTPVDITDTTTTRYTADTSFTMEGWIFKQDSNPNGEIRTIEATFEAIENFEFFNVDDALIDPNAVTESFTISGWPILAAATPYYTLSGAPYDIEIYGTFIRGISSAYLSGGVFPTASSTYINPFSAMPTLSADNPGFYGFEIPFTINSENAITIQVPPAIRVGFFDVIFTNHVGYGKLTTDTNSPYASGIRVFGT